MTSLRVLAIDTSTAISAVALVEGERVLAEDDAPSEVRHAEVLLPRVRGVLAQAGLAPQDVGLIAVGIGPGSFTGLRVGLASAKGLAIGLGVPLRAVCSLSALAAGVPAGAEVLRVTAVDAGKGELFVAAFSGEPAALRVELAPLRASPEHARLKLSGLCAASPRQVVLCGNGARAHAGLREALGPRCALAEAAFDTPRGRHVAWLALAALAASGPSDLATLEPSYLRDSDAKLPARPLAL